MRVFFDASIIIAALLSPIGGSSYLLKFIKTGHIIGITSQTVIDEVLESDKPEKLKKTRGEIEQFIAKSGLLIREAITLQELAPFQQAIAREDAHLIAGAKLTKCAYLVSFDKKHVLVESVKKQFYPLKIVTPKEILEELLRS